MNKSFAKTLSANDAGKTNSHQAGICVPRINNELLDFFPRLDPQIINPDCWLTCVDEKGRTWKFRYIYYNGKLHDTSTRNEYRITHTTKYLKGLNADEGDLMVFSKRKVENNFLIRLVKESKKEMQVSSFNQSGYTTQNNKQSNFKKRVVKLRGWQRIH